MVCIFKLWTKSLEPQCSPHAPGMVPVPCSGPAWIASSRGGYLHFLLGWLATPRFGVLGKSGRGGGTTPHHPAASPGLGKPGLHVQRRSLSLSRGKARAQLPRGTSRAGSSTGLCCYSRRCQAALLTPSPGQLSTLFQGSRMSSYLPVPQRSDVRGQTPSAPHHISPAQVGSALLHCRTTPDKASLPKHSWPLGQLTSAPVVTSPGEGGWQLGS